VRRAGRDDRDQVGLHGVEHLIEVGEARDA